MRNASFASVGTPNSPAENDFDARKRRRELRHHQRIARAASRDDQFIDSSRAAK